MLSYYSTVILLSWMALAVLCVLVHENDRINKEEKLRFYLTYMMIAAAALAEWLGIQLNGREELPKWPLLAVKCADYILTPLAGGTVVYQQKTLTVIIIGADRGNNPPVGSDFVRFCAVCEWRRCDKLFNCDGKKCKTAKTRRNQGLQGIFWEIFHLQS